MRIIGPRKLDGRRAGGGFTLLELLVCTVIIGIIAAFTAVSVGGEDSSTRVDRAAQQVIAAMRYARVLSMGHGETSGSTYQPTDAYGVQIDTSAGTVTVYHCTWNAALGVWTLPGTAVADALHTGGSYVINFNTDPTCAGVSISAVQLTGTADTSSNGGSPYYCQYRPFGDTENPGTATAAITLSYGGNSRTITVPQVGDPQEN